MNEQCVRRYRRKYQRTRKCEKGRMRNLYEEYSNCLRQYRSMMIEQKEKNWREFVEKEENRDPWGLLYKIWRGKRKNDTLSHI